MNPRPEHFDALAHAIRTCSSPNRRRDLEEIRSFLSTVSADLSDIDDGEPDDNDDNDIASLKAHIAELEARGKAQHEVMTDMVAERNSLRAEIAAAYGDRASSKSVLANVIAERNALKRRVAELEKRITHAVALLHTSVLMNTKHELALRILEGKEEAHGK